MPVNSTHPDYDAALSAWLRARDVLAGEDAMKRGGEKYVPRLFGNTDDEYAAYVGRACFFNATSRTAAAYLGLVFRRSPFVKLPDASSPVGKALAEFSRDADLRGTPLTTYARDVVSEVIAVGRCGSLVDWINDGEDRAYVSRYTAENILNWRVERINGRNLLTMVVLYEPDAGVLLPGSDEFQNNSGGQIRVVRLARGSSSESRIVPLHCVVDVWQRGSSVAASNTSGTSDGWQLVERHVPRRLGKALPRIPFVFHGPRNSLPDVDAVPLADVISVNLDHFRLDADFKHGMHFTALPTAWVSGFDKESTLRIGSSTAWTTDTVGATAGFLEYKGQGLRTFERAQDRDERQMAVLGARMLESSKKVGETAEAIELRQAGENSILGNLALSVSASLSAMLSWVFWWNSTVELPDLVGAESVVIELNTDYSLKNLSAAEITSLVAAWQCGAMSRDTLLDVFRRGELLPEGRTNAEEAQLIELEVAQRRVALPEVSSSAASGFALPPKPPAEINSGVQPQNQP